MKVRERKEARRLRREEGLSIKTIAARLGVALSSVSLWVRDVELSSAQVLALREANPALNGQLKAQEALRKRARVARVEAQEHGRQLARAGNGIHLAGCMLYWAEGSKGRNAAQLVNSDAHMLRYFVRFLGQCYDIAPERLKFSVNCYVNNGLTIEQIEEWWLSTLALPQSSVRKHIINRPSVASKQLKRNLPYGTARVCLHSTFVVQSIYGAIQEYAGFDEPAWLD